MGFQGFVESSPEAIPVLPLTGSQLKLNHVLVWLCQGQEIYSDACPRRDRMDTWQRPQEYLCDENP
jgi:hypothetical protein